MYMFNRVMVVNHHPPHIWEPFETDDTVTINQINAVRYSLLEYKDDTTGEYQYLDIPKHINNIDGTLTPTQLLPIHLTSRKPRMSMFIYDNLREAPLSYSLADVPGRHVHDRHDILVEGYSDTDRYDHNSLFTIGGIIHRSHMSGPQSYIIDGGVTAQYRLNVGRVYLPDTLKWDEHDITSDMLSTTSNYMDDCVITLAIPPGPGEVPVFVIGGYLVPLGSMVTALAGDTYRIDLTNSQYINRMVDQDGIIAASVNTGDILDVDLLREDAHIMSVFDASQTFVIYVRAQSTTTHIYPVPQTSIAGKYFVSHIPRLPMITGHGNLVDYVTSSSCGCYTVHVNDERIKRYLASPEIHGRITGGIDPTDITYRRTAWQAIYVVVK